MEGALIVIPLVGLVVPIMLLIAALAFDSAVAIWVVFRMVHDRFAHH